MSKSSRSSVSFWSVALVATAVALFSSVQLGKAIGAEMLAHGVVKVAPQPLHVSASASKSEVVGARPFVAGAPGQPTPR